MRTPEFAILATLLLALAGCKTEDPGRAPRLAYGGDTDPIATGAIRAAGFTVEPGVVNWYTERGAALPVGDTLAYCHGFGCEFKTAIRMGEAEYGALAAIFARHRGGPDDERRAIDHADRWWESYAAPQLGGPPDKRGSELADAHKPGQTDCLDEATNTTSLLVYLERKGLLRHHHVKRPESRGAFLYAHATAVIEDRTTGVDWVADSWMRDSGDPIDVMTLEEWFSRAYVDPVG